MLLATLCFGRVHANIQVVIIALLLPAFFAAGTAARADSVRMKGGSQFSGHVMEENDKYVKIQTANSGVITIPMERVEKVLRENLNPEELKADQVFRQGKKYEALKMYEQIWAAKTGSAGLEQKIAAVKDTIKQEEEAKYKSLFREAAEFSNAGNFAKTRAKLAEVLQQAASDTLTARRARRLIAVEFLKESKYYDNLVQYSSALQCIKSAVEADGAMSSARLEYARKLRDYGYQFTSATIEQFETGIQEGRKFLALPKRDQEDILALEPPEFQMNIARLSEARFELLEIYFKAGLKQQGVESCQAILEDSTIKLPKSKMDKIVARIGDVLTAIDPNLRLDRKKTLEGLSIALKYNPDLLIALFWKGRLYLEDEATSLALKAFDQAIEKAETLKEDPPRTIYFYRGKALLREKQYNEAADSLNEALQRATADKLSGDERYEAYCMLGDLTLQGNPDRPELAQDPFTKAIQLQPEKVRALVGRAKVNRQIAQAIMLELENQSNPERKKDMEAKAQQLRESALADITGVLQRIKDNPEAVLEKARLYKDGNQTKEASDTFTQLIRDLESGKVYSTSATLQMQRSRKELVAEAYVDLGEIELKINNRPSAESNFRKALSAQPNFARAWKFLGDLSKKVNDFDHAVENYDKATKADPEFPDYEMHLAIAYEEWQKYKEARDHYELYRKKGGRDIRVQSWIDSCTAKIK